MDLEESSPGESVSPVQAASLAFSMVQIDAQRKVVGVLKADKRGSGVVVKVCIFSTKKYIRTHNFEVAFYCIECSKTGD